jgi:hypothetical protein
MKVVEISQTIRKHTTKMFTPDEVIIAIPKRGNRLEEFEDEEEDEDEN